MRSLALLAYRQTAHLKRQKPATTTQLQQQQQRQQQQEQRRRRLICRAVRDLLSLLDARVAKEGDAFAEAGWLFL